MFMYSADLGLSSFNAVLIEDKEIKKKKRVFLNPKKSVSKQRQEFLSDKFFSDAETIALTGANSIKIKEIQGKKIIKVNEIEAIAKGASFLSKQKEFLAASAGTGICFVSVKRKKNAHIGGTAIGGRTLLGLSYFLTKKTDFKEIESCAKKGNLKKMDLMLKDVYPKGIGLLKKNVSVAHFGKTKSRKKEDLCAGVFNMVSQGISTHALLAAKSAGHKKIVFVGSLAESSLFKKTFNECKKVFDLAEGIFPKNAGYATAIGAALIASETKKRK